MITPSPAPEPASEATEVDLSYCVVNNDGRDYLIEATDWHRHALPFQPGKASSYYGYGYQFWLHPLKERSFAFQGVHGQSVFVQPASGIVMVQTAVYAQASGQQDPEPYAERTAFWMGVLQSLGGRTERY